MQNRLFILLALALNLFLWSSCQGPGTLTSGISHESEDPLPVNYSIIYMIHGDASYLYHDSDGKPRQADQDIFNEAVSVARNALRGEVFIFHQKPERKLLWLFPRKDRVLLHFRNGQLVRRVRYSPIDASQSFAAEAEFYHRHSSSFPSEEELTTVFLYFGHEIPQTAGYRYHSSRPSVPFNLSTFSRGIQSFLPSDQDLFDLIVLSSCNNGSPDVAHTLSSYSRYLLASPQNLHLSHIDTQALTVLEQDPTSARKIAGLMAQATYERLTGFLQTVVSLSVYRLHGMERYLRDLSSAYKSYLQERPPSHHNIDNTDCAHLPFYAALGDSASPAVQTWYKAPRFGQKVKNQSHSGWGCRQ